MGCSMRPKQSLGSHFDKFLKAQIESGRYENENDVLRAGLRLLEEREQDLIAPREALDALLAEAEVDLAEGRFHTLEAAFASLDERYRGGAKPRD